MKKPDTAVTRLVQRPDGTEILEMRRAMLQVLDGPDAGKQLMVEQARIRVGSGAECELQLSDPAVSRQHLELRATDQGFVVEDLQSTNGTELEGARVERALLLRSTTFSLGDTRIRISPCEETVELPLSQRRTFGGLLGQSPTMRQVFALMERVAPADTTVLLQGESGTGKELAAEAIHQNSPRANGPFMVVDCGALSAELVEGELFGHQKGAFTGADAARIGALEAAHGGTVFFDEIGELPLDLQPRLLRFLERRQIRRLGSNETQLVDVRVIAATNRDLAHEVSKRTFREDLYYRLSVVQIELPPLRTRPEDVVLLAYHFAERFVRDPRQLVDEVLPLLSAHRWPGNVRELRNVIERLAVAPQLAIEGLQPQGEAETTNSASEGGHGIGQLCDKPFHEARNLWQDRFEREYLSAQIERAGGVVARAAELSEIPRQTFHRLLRRHGLR